MKRWLPLILFGILSLFLYGGLWLNPREVPSPLIGQNAPSFQLPVVGKPSETFSPAMAQGRPWLLNIWAPWCTTCRKEHFHLMQLAQKGAPLYGLNWKDSAGEAATLLKQIGNPYVLTADDRDGRVGIDWGTTGVPETYVIDAQGIIRMKHSGPLNPRVWEQRIAPLLKELGL